MSGELVFLDTNILLSATDRGRPSHTAAQSVFPQALTAGVHLAISGQVLREYLVASTRPLSANGLGLGLSDAVHNVNTFRRRAVFLEESETVADELLRLLGSADVSGKRVHDANIVATMATHNVALLLTENPDDFAVFSGIDTLSPTEFGHRFGVPS